MGAQSGQQERPLAVRIFGRRELRVDGTRLVPRELGGVKPGSISRWSCSNEGTPSPRTGWPSSTAVVMASARLLTSARPMLAGHAAASVPAATAERV